jgi:hypothetical protein
MRAYCIFLLFILFSCQEDLKGHWHAEAFDGQIVSFEILGNNKAYIFDSLNADPLEGGYDTSKNELWFPGECGSLLFEYQYKQGKLYLTNALGVRVVAERIEAPCNRFEDFPTQLKMECLTIQNLRNTLNPTDSLKTHLKEYIGIAYSTHKDSILLEHRWRIFPLEKTNEILQHVQETHSDDELPYIHYILTPSKNLRAKDLKRVVDQLPPNNSLFLRTLKDSIINWKAFEFISLKSVNLNSDKTLEQLIN